VFKYNLFAIHTLSEPTIVNIHDSELELHLRLEFAGARVYAIARVKLHVLDRLFGLVGILSFEFKTTRHETLDFVTAGYTGSWLGFGLQSWRALGLFTPLLDPSLLLRLKLFSGHLICELAIMWSASFWKREIRGVDVGFKIVIANLVLLAEPADVVGNVCPGPETVYFSAFQQQEFFVGPPFAFENGKRVLFDYPELVGPGVVVIARLSFGEAGDA
jgi:hypothetical protein